jgi:virulence-associated protein VagC
MSAMKTKTRRPKAISSDNKLEAKVVKRADGHAIVFPREIEFEGKTVSVRRCGKMLVIFEPRDAKALFLSSIGQMSDDFMNPRR